MSDRQMSDQESDVRVRRAIVLDWYDGPREGLMVAENGREWHFKVVGDPFDNGSGLLYVLRPLAGGSLSRLAGHLPGASSMTVPVWVPRWQFPTTQDQELADAAVRAALANARDGEVYAQYTARMDLLAAWWAV